MSGIDERDSTGIASGVSVRKSDPATFDTAENCVECSAHSFARSSAGEWYCEECGVIQTETEIEYSEPNWLPWEERRVGPASTYSRVSVGTIIDVSDNDVYPNWAEYNKRLDQSQQTLRHGLLEVRALAAALELSDIIVEQASYLFRQAANQKLLRGQSIEAVAGACIHATVRKNKLPFSLKHIAVMSPIAEEKIRSAYSKLVQHFKLPICPPLPTLYISRFVSEAGLSNEVRTHAFQLAQQLIEEDVHIGQSPPGFAAAIIYAAAKEHEEEVSQEEVAAIGIVGVVTVSRQWQKIKKYIEPDYYENGQ